MNRRTMRAVGATVIVTLLVLILIGIGYMYSGAYNVAATAGHTGLTRWALETVQERSVDVRGDEVGEPPPIDSARLEHGFEHYHAMCVMCHGAPGIERGEVGRGLTPTPPDLSEEAPEYTASELFWITKHGIKLAGMPAFGPTHSDAQLWGIVAFVERLPEMTAEEYQGWVDRVFAVAGDSAQAGGAAGSAGGAAGGHSHAPGTPAHGH